MNHNHIAQGRAELARRLRAKEFVAAPGVFDLISARVADPMGFQALYMTGYGTVASYLGLPDAGLATYSDMVSRVKQICTIVKSPLIADADTGYGGLLNVAHTVKGYEAAGAAGIQLEDQEFPKKCGHTPGRKVIPVGDMVAKIKVAVEARTDPNCMIIARTDARTTLGINEAISRMKAYDAAGADILFVESPETEAEMAQICSSFKKPTLANMVESGRTPVLPKGKLVELGYAIAIYPSAGFLAVGAALDTVYKTIRETGSSLGTSQKQYDFMAFSRLMGFEEVWEFDKAHAE